MDDIKQEIEKVFGNHLRMRISGICIVEESILLIKHLSIGPKGILWAPPGGGMIFGQSITDTLKREFLEETGLIVEVGSLILVNEFLETPLHAVELFFKVNIIGGNLIKGSDPEISSENQIIAEIKFFPFSELPHEDLDTFHSLFRTYKNPSDFLQPVLFKQNIRH